MKQRRDKIPIDEDTLRRMYLDELMSTTEIAAALYISTKTARNMLNEIGIMRSAMDTRILRQKQRKVRAVLIDPLNADASEEARAAIIQALNSSPNTFVAANKLGVSMSSLYTNIKRLGITKRVEITWE